MMCALQATLETVKPATFAFLVTILALLVRTKTELLAFSAHLPSPSSWLKVILAFLIVVEDTTRPRVSSKHAPNVIGPVPTVTEKHKFAPSALDQMNSLFHWMVYRTPHLCPPSSITSVFRNALLNSLARMVDVSNVKIPAELVKISPVSASPAMTNPIKSTCMLVSAMKIAPVVHQTVSQKTIL